MEFLGTLRELGLTEWLFSILVALVIMHYVGLLKPLTDGVKGLFNKVYASEQQTIVMTDRLFNFALDSADQSKEIISLLSDLKNLIEYLAREDIRDREIRSDIDIFMHELNQKHAAEIRLLQSMARSIERLSKDQLVSKDD